jgi:hypothetical protein
MSTPPVLRLARLGVLFVAILFIAFWLLWVLLISGIAEDVEARIDFFAYWAGSSLALDGEAAAAFDEARMIEVQAPLPGDPASAFVWLYPPPFFLFVLPLGLAPVAAALFVWVLLTATLMFSAIRRITLDGTLLGLALLFPATVWNFLIGQNGMLTAGLFAWGMLLMRDRPVLAGSLLGLMTYKPQFFPLVFLALLAGRQKQAAISAVAAAAVAGVASLLLFGAASWDAFITTITTAGDSIYSGTGADLEKMQSISATLLLLGSPVIVAQLMQGLFALAAAGFVVWLWRSQAAFEYRVSGLAFAVLLATPYSYHYDLTLLGMGALWLGLRLRREGALDWRHTALLVTAWVSPFVGPLIGRNTDVVLGPFLLLLLATVVATRAWSEVPRAAPSKRANPSTEEPARISV